MKRILCGAALVAAAVASAPAHASEAPVHVYVINDGTRVGVTATYGTSGNYTPIGGATVNTQTGRVCVGLSYQIPVCTDPII